MPEGVNGNKTFSPPVTCRWPSSERAIIRAFLTLCAAAKRRSYACGENSLQTKKAVDTNSKAMVYYNLRDVNIYIYYNNILAHFERFVKCFFEGRLVFMDDFSLVKQSGSVDIARCNETARKFGITLSQRDAGALNNARVKALRRTGRVEFTGGIIEKLVFAFCDSPYLEQDGFTEAMEELIEIFYEFKNDSLDEPDDDEVISLMKKYFDGECSGSTDALRDDMSRAARNIRYGCEDEEDEAYEEYFRGDYDE